MDIEIKENIIDKMNTFHHFGESMYAREMRIEKGWVVKSHRHKFDHMSILASGKVFVEVEGVRTVYEAPAVVNIKKEEHHMIYAYEDTVWFCIHKSEDCSADGSLDKILLEEV